MLNSRLSIFIALTLPIILFSLPLLLTKNKLAAGDADYLTQTYEAMRISLLEYRQFPWWNPWVSGGVPLFANPQFGLISIATPLVLVFGAPFGMKLTIMCYFIIGFWGFRKLFINFFNTPHVTATLLAYIWTFGSFLTHRSSGHYTFLLIQLFPWALYFFLSRKTDSRAWLKFGLVIGLMANSAAHYMTILSYIVIGIMFVLESVRLAIEWKQKRISLKVIATRQDLIFWTKAGTLFIVLSFYRLFFTFQYLSDYPRLTTNPETSIGPIKALFAIFGPLRQFGPATPSVPLWSWLEASAYIGICTGVVALLIIWTYCRAGGHRNKLFSYSPPIILLMIVVFFILGLGDFMGKFSPFLLLKELPVLSSMRVASRWLAWSSVFILIFISAYKSQRFRTLINILLLISVVELFITSMPYLSKPYVINITEPVSRNQTIQQKKEHNNKRLGITYDENLTEATKENIGQLIAGDSLIDTRFAPPVGTETSRCSVDDGCPFVLSKNASVTSWSPNKITLQRMGDGLIELNTNPGSCWTANGRPLFPRTKITQPNERFLINESSSVITISCEPKYSAEWIFTKVFN